METTTQQDEPLTDTLKPIYARFIFDEQEQALAFAGLINEPDWTVSVDYAPSRARWQASVRRQIRPMFRDITIWLVTLTARMALLGGECDGWGHENQI
ncbi:MAG: ribonuclease E inhibitor RraB [Formivibrio sp.]|nr:ribonuclease E inhibitor RraB [Formivibrio sp.]